MGDLGWEKEQAETAKNEALRQKGRDDRAAGRPENSGEDPRSTANQTYKDGYGS